MNSLFQHYVSTYASRGFLDNQDLRALRDAATDAPLDENTESLIRLHNASERLAAQVIIERCIARREIVNRALDVAEGHAISGGAAEALVADLRGLEGNVPAELARKLACGPQWHFVADAIARLTASKQTRRH